MAETDYEYGRIARLAEALAEARIARDVSERILEGGESIKRDTKPEAKAAWMGEAMRRMDELLDEETRHAAREACACCLGGERGKLSKAIGKRGGSLEERIAAADETKLVFGHSVTLQDDGTVRVAFAPEGQERYGCPCLPKAKQPLPITYCYCCGGHVKHHLKAALGRKLSVEVLSSALSSGGRAPCVFDFAIVAGEGAGA